MLNAKKIILLTVISLTIVACGSTPYKKTGWTNSNKESDWDIDSAVCLQKSQKLSDSDLQKIKAIKVEEQATQAMLNQQLKFSQQQQGKYSDAINVMGALGTMFSKSSEVTAEDTIKDANFKKCLKNKGWGKKS